MLVGMQEIRRHGKSSFFHPVSNWIRTKRGKKTISLLPQNSKVHREMYVTNPPEAFSTTEY